MLTIIACHTIPVSALIANGMVVKCECSSFSILSGYLYDCKSIDEPIQWLNNRFI